MALVTLEYVWILAFIAYQLSDLVLAGLFSKRVSAMQSLYNSCGIERLFLYDDRKNKNLTSSSQNGTPATH